MIDAFFSSKLGSDIKLLIEEAIRTSYDLFKIMVPISLLVRMLKVLGLIDYLGMALRPMMELMGLPGSMGMVWAAAMTNFYAGVAAFTSLVPDASLSVAQVTVLTTVMLVAHSIPVELRIAQKAGTRMRAMALIRIGGAFFLGWALFQSYRITGSLQNTSTMIWATTVDEVTWLDWGIKEVKNLLMIFCIVLTLLFLMKLLTKLKVIAFLTRILDPIFRMAGISSKASPIAIVGLTMGLTYGGGLIIQESRSGNLTQRDVFVTLTLMGLSHGMIEDTLFMLALGGHISGVLWGRALFTILMVFTMAKVLAVLPQKSLDRFFFREVIPNRDPKKQTVPHLRE
jgi:hypothetical protein